MTIENENVRQQHSVVNAQADYGFNFKILNQEDLKVVLSTSAAVDTVQTLTTHYTVSGVGSQNGGTVTFTAGNIPATSSSATVTLILDPEFKQSMDLSYGIAIDSEALEAALDSNVNLAKRSKDISERVLNLTDGSAATGGSWDANSNKLASLTAGTVSTDAVNKAQLDAVEAQVTSNDTEIAALQTINLRRFHCDTLVATVFNSATATGVPFTDVASIDPSSALSSGVFTAPQTGLYFLSVVLSPNNGALTNGDIWRISLGTPGAEGARRHWFEVDPVLPAETIVLSSTLQLPAGTAVRAYVARALGTGVFQLNGLASDNSFSGFLVG
tara:strand:+ start:372 stop:1358 length:987 start_codon:yes stop_codon:yes gene_type:complete